MQRPGSPVPTLHRSRPAVPELSPSNFRANGLNKQLPGVPAWAGQGDPSSAGTNGVRCQAGSAPLDACTVQMCTRERDDGSCSPSRDLQLAPRVLFRPVEVDDLLPLQELHDAIFPIRYEMEFYLHVVQRKGIMSWVACSASNPTHLLGFITARVLDPTETEASCVLQTAFFPQRRALVYILTLGVKKEYRNSGIASELVKRVVEYARADPWCQGVFLHVVTYNLPAIHFYNRLHFMSLRLAPSFYYLEGQAYDALIFVRYINGGQPPSSSFLYGLAAPSPTTCGCDP